jgi:uncharacterized protein (DUF2141 family)
MINIMNLKRGILSLLGLAAVILTVPPASAEQSSITVNLSGIRSQKGNIIVCLWGKENREFPFCSSAAAYKSTSIKANSSSVVATFQNIPSGEYAISAFHDENGNGKLDRNWMGMPKEGMAAPNIDKEKNQDPNRPARPSFDKMKFKLSGSTTLSSSFMYR